jgi:uncharacterized protein
MSVDLALTRIHAVIDATGPLIIACSGGIDSLLLSVIAHRRVPGSVLIAHAISPAVQPDSSARVRHWADQEGWTLQIAQSTEFEDEKYLSNPVNRCYFCKSGLYLALQSIREAIVADGTIVSGANLDDLGEYRPGLDAASENGVRHPWIEADIGKEDIRAIARHLDLPFAHIPSSPCLASRLYTGTRVTSSRLRAVDECETLIRSETGVAIVRCRIKENIMLIEVPDPDRHLISIDLIDRVQRLAQSIETGIHAVEMDAAAYRAGRAFVGAS